MKVALIGASGFVGKAIQDELVERGRQVTAIVRNPEKVKQAEQVIVVKTNVLNEKETTEAVKDHDVV